MALDTSTDRNRTDQVFHLDHDDQVNPSETYDPGHHHSETGHDDHQSEPEPRLRDLPLSVWNIPRFIVLGFIRLYQATFSRALPPGTCRFYPSCSHYGYQAIYKYGVLKGGVMAAWRVLRCNPFNPGGFDPVP
jgi:putative membrane protein insertion efficiency factor